MSIGQTWNTAAYSEHGRFVATLGSAVLDLLAPQPGERVLDLGCGDGALTEQIAAAGAFVTGIDASLDMVEAARTRGLLVDHGSAAALPYTNEFDAVFSNAALHWVPDAPAVLRGVHRALRPGGRFVAEMGGHGNIAAIRTALQAVLGAFALDAEAAANSFFPTAAAYRALLEENGFTVQSIDLLSRPTALPGGRDGIEIWLNTFRNGVLDRLTPADRSLALIRTVDLMRPILADTQGEWIADYVRLRFHATRSAS